MQVPDKVMPVFLKKIISVLPAKPPAWVLVNTLNQLLRREILLADMSLLAGRHFRIVVSDLGLNLCFSASNERFMAADAAGVVDLCLSANTADFMKMLLRQEDPDTLFFNRRLKIEGDTELGLVVKNLLDSIDWSTVPVMKSLVGQ
ncbi:Sterol-binding domain protein [Snodgrassella alvi]|uniref:ubiquinone anaerobic biosynthesis accessory factor UbiT n=1 Tax=Snodgrassella alvi TaxID=1196083 RepID=UPI000A051AA7|nr:SCP2 sterol-binding domain-containing protein [Snodgrassella alvi]ORF00674.1 Sterol-binding domain protein [Snodgrassella alvi]ORF07036.1 Sterol-binding domain protein [Snodgrassella alvi]ORF10343.1 Sterol-binding domain protein [Snodgrassella alvi]ORF11983.1 Sterol-binding domain protein [Snodgrassella alvi]ORF21163.1 Sterol-binding domain protein [Snodgrassella alvi]